MTRTKVISARASPVTAGDRLAGRMRTKPEPWPPPELSLPDLETLDRLSLPDGGPIVQAELLPEQPQALFSRRSICHAYLP